MSDYRERIGRKHLENKVMSADEAARMIKDGMTVGMSGFTRSGDAKLVPFALAELAKTEPRKIYLMTGASLGLDIDGVLTSAGVMARRLPFQSDATLRKAINAGSVMYLDQHLSETAEWLRAHMLPKIDVAVIEAVYITPEGGIVPTSSVGNSALFAMQADKVIIELNIAHSMDLVGIHDIYTPGQRPHREPIPLTRCDQRIGTTFIPVDPEKIAAIVISEKPDSPALIVPPDEETQSIANHIIEFFTHQVKKGNLSHSLMPIQAGIGSVANAVLSGFLDGPFHDLTMYSEVLQDSTFELFDAGKMVFGSAAALSLSKQCGDLFFNNVAKYRDRMVLRPQEISNNPEIARRLGLICINTALECDIYGNINSTHVSGTHMMNGIGGSGDFSRTAAISVFVTKSLAKDGKISSIVPMVSHHDHTEHDVDLIVTERGLADLRGLAPRERPEVIIQNCVHPQYQDMARDYVKEALKRGGHTPHVLEKAFSWHGALREHGDMRKATL